MSPAATPERWRHIEDIFHHALDLPRTERSAYLAGSCGGDATLRREVESLLEAVGENSTLIEDSLSSPPRDLYGSGSLAAGDRVSHYRIIALIGSGGMGRVYLAEDTRVGRRVALKILAPGALQPAHLRRFEQEARAASALNHPNILTIYDVGEDGARRFIISEYVEGKTLRALMDEGPLDAARALSIGAQIAAGLEAAHSLGIAHRDIKPENVIVRPDGLVKLVDFGIARLNETSSLECGTGGTATTRAGMVVGAARYMSPEQARGLPVDERTDVFSAGVVFYEMLAGRTPFECETESDLMAAVLKTAPPPLESPQIPAALIRLVIKAVAKNPMDRYANGGELRVALWDVSRTKSAAPAHARLQLRRWWIVFAALLVFAAVLVAWRCSA
jgi:serine/threonine protein kinase